VADPGRDHREFSPVEPRADTMKLRVGDWPAIDGAAPERGDLARECVKEQYQAMELRALEPRAANQQNCPRMRSRQAPLFSRNVEGADRHA
jgi:hypothetical protein